MLDKVGIDVTIEEQVTLKLTVGRAGSFVVQVTVPAGPEVPADAGVVQVTAMLPDAFGARSNGSAARPRPAPPRPAAESTRPSV